MLKNYSSDWTKDISGSELATPAQELIIILTRFSDFDRPRFSCKRSRSDRWLGKRIRSSYLRRQNHRSLCCNWDVWYFTLSTSNQRSQTRGPHVALLTSVCGPALSSKFLKLLLKLKLHVIFEHFLPTFVALGDISCLLVRPANYILVKMWPSYLFGFETPGLHCVECVSRI